MARKLAYVLAKRRKAGGEPQGGTVVLKGASALNTATACRMVWAEGRDMVLPTPSTGPLKGPGRLQ
ncbi:MAG: hypothetical protein O3A88_07375 [Proteobacteria bacterium]|nr:hypothetical protein [Pseudomonadota bacterium]